MKRDTDSIRSFILGLLEYFSWTVSSPSGKVDNLDETLSQANSMSEPLGTSSNNREGSPIPPVQESSPSTFSSDFSMKMPPLSELGEMPAVQNHLQTVLKRRLQTEIDQNPPLFPWESDLQEYPVDISVDVPAPWLAQLRSLQLPTALPEDILAGLLSRCQNLVSESLQPGIQLVKAVEALFPDQPQAMDQIAGLVLANATMRDLSSQHEMEALKEAFPEGYEGANPQQQVTLAMLAAKDILHALTIVLTPQAPTAQRDWLTTEGKITLTARYQAGTPNQINLSVELPQAGQLSLPSLGQTMAQDRPGTLNLLVPEPKANEAYPLEILLCDRDSKPLTFSIRWSEGI